ncbi:MAG: hypothetical protein K2M79_01020 [Muribaculaceae bacterium]|nr:hypothetical protein [Muribaculaceae bacterium]
MLKYLAATVVMLSAAVCGNAGTVEPDSVPSEVEMLIVDPFVAAFDSNDDSVTLLAPDTVVTPNPAKLRHTIDEFNVWEEREVAFNPSPTRAVWMSALFPGLGQIYNRRYWKLPVVVGAFMGLGYATQWNNTMLTDYTRAYRDLLDNDPGTNSYMNFFPPTTSESDLDKTWLRNLLQSRKNYFRRNRDLCIIGMVGVYLLAMVDAYVDASLAHFDISPDLSMDVVPTLMQDGRGVLPSVGFLWAFNF